MVAVHVNEMDQTFSLYSLPELISDTSNKTKHAEYSASSQLPLQNGKKHGNAFAVSGGQAFVSIRMMLGRINFLS